MRRSFRSFILNTFRSRHPVEDQGHLEVQEGVPEDDGFVQTLYQCSLCHQVMMRHSHRIIRESNVANYCHIGEFLRKPSFTLLLHKVCCPEGAE